MFDIFSPIGDIFGTIAQWVGYGLIATFAVGSLFLLVVVPVMFKVAAVAFARVLVVETSNIIAKSGIAVQVSNAVNAVSETANTITKEINKNKMQVIKVNERELENWKS